MTWSRHYNLHLNTSGDGAANQILEWRDDSASVRGTKVIWTWGDHFTLRLFLVDFDSDPAATLELPGTDAIKLAAKDSSALAAGATLFAVTGFAQILDGNKTGYEADLNLNTDELDAWFTANPTSNEVGCQVDVEVRNSDNSRRWTIVPTIYVRRQGLDDTADPTPSEEPYPDPGQLVTKIRGSAAITSGSSTVTVSGLSLAAAPAQILLTVRCPSGGVVLFASPVDGSESTAGFTALLSAAPPATGYKLDYLLVLP